MICAAANMFEENLVKEINGKLKISIQTIEEL